MNHPQVHRKESSSTVATSVSSIIFSIIASSHHWLHMGILLVLGSSTNMMSAMSGVIWLRRAMVIATLITSLYGLYRLKKHKHMPPWLRAISLFSILISFGFLIYTISKFGW